MAKPLLLFPTPGPAPRTKRPGFMSPLRRPSHDKQGKRLLPKFEELQEKFKDERIKFQQTAAGAEPTKVLVMETVGGIGDFARAVKAMEGLEWMGELIDEFDFDEVDDGFYDDEDNKEKRIPGRLYLVMTNQQGVKNLFSLWKRFSENKNMEFPRGMTPFREIFNYLNEIRYWGVKDRIEATGLLKAWEDELNSDGEFFVEVDFVKVEVELWFQRSEEKRKKSQKEVEKLIIENDGKVINDCVIDEIEYHGVLAEIPRKLVEEIINDSNVELLECEDVMFYSPVGQAITDEREIAEEPSVHESPDTPLPSGNPIVGILDGMPIENHEQLKGRLEMDTPDGYTDNYSAEERKHGTSMASLIIHGDLEDDEKTPLSHPLYMRPIMKYLEKARGERVPKEEILVDLIHRAVVRMFKGEGGKEPEAPDVKIINLSIGMPSRPFLRMMSPLARLLDWLSCEYNVLFVISAGNHKKEIKIEKSWEDFEALLDGEKEAAFIKSIYKEERYRKILSPAESINGITVGALHDDEAKATSLLPPRVMELYKSRFLPSPISTFGGGHRRAIKPDLVYKGGRRCYDEPLSKRSPLRFELNKNLLPTGVKSACPGPPGELDRCAHSCGTSNATALVSRLGAKCHDTLLEILNGQTPNGDVSASITPLIKAMVVHGCSWGDAGDRLKSILRTDRNGRQIKNMIGRWLGYGVPDYKRVLECTDKRATLLGFGQLEGDEAHLFKLPLPPSLDGKHGLRRLIVTLAWFSPIKPSVNAYRAAKLWFEIPKENFDKFQVGRQNADWNAVRRGTVQHEVFEGERAIVISNGDDLTIKVNCQKDAAEIVQPVSYGLAVTLEVSEKIDISIYKEMASRIKVQVN